MSIFDKYQGEGGYVFVSHSHNDIADVREVRNYLEKEGFEPILFYLKSMDDGDDSKTSTLRKLIYDEIDARQFFLYLDSENARKSEWVRDELEYVKRNHPERLVSIDLKKHKCIILDEIKCLLKNMRIFISYSGKDYPLATLLKEYLVKNDFRVFSDNMSSTCFPSDIDNMIKEVSKNGIVITLVTENSVHSNMVLRELELAITNNATILPIVVGGDHFKLMKTLGDKFSRLMYLTLPEYYANYDLEALVNKIKVIARNMHK